MPEPIARNASSVYDNQSYLDDYPISSNASQTSGATQAPAPSAAPATKQPARQAKAQHKLTTSSKLAAAVSVKRPASSGTAEAAPASDHQQAGFISDVAKKAAKTALGPYGVALDVASVCAKSPLPCVAVASAYVALETIVFAEPGENPGLEGQTCGTPSEPSTPPQSPTEPTNPSRAPHSASSCELGPVE